MARSGSLGPLLRRGRIRTVRSAPSGERFGRRTAATATGGSPAVSRPVTSWSRRSSISSATASPSRRPLRWRNVPACHGASCSTTSGPSAPCWWPGWPSSASATVPCCSPCPHAARRACGWKHSADSGGSTSRSSPPSTGWRAPGPGRHRPWPRCSPGTAPTCAGSWRPPWRPRWPARGADAGALLDALEQATGWETWRSLRDVRGRTAAAAERAIAFTALQLLT